MIQDKNIIRIKTIYIQAKSKNKVQCTLGEKSIWKPLVVQVVQLKKMRSVILIISTL